MNHFSLLRIQLLIIFLTLSGLSFTQTTFYSTGFEGVVSGPTLLGTATSIDGWLTNDNSFQGTESYDFYGYHFVDDYGYPVDWQLRNSWAIMNNSHANTPAELPINGNYTLGMCRLFGPDGLSYYAIITHYDFGTQQVEYYGTFFYWTQELPVPTDRWSYRNIPTTGYSNISMTFKWRCYAEGPGQDFGQVGYSIDGGASYNWLNTGGTDNLGNYYHRSYTNTQTITFPPECDNNPNFVVAFRFQADLDDYPWFYDAAPAFMIDDVSLSGYDNTFTCAVPQNFNASIGNPANGLQHHINLTWNAVTAASGYRIDVSPDGVSNWVNIFEGNSTSFDYNTGDNPNKQYFFRIRAFSGVTECANSSPISIYTACDIPNLSVLGSALNSITLQLLHETPVQNPAITTYAIFCTTTGQWVQSVNGPLGGTANYQNWNFWNTSGNIMITGLNQGQQYCFYAIARNAQNDNRPGYIYCATTQSCTPPSISISPANATQCSGSSITFTSVSSGIGTLSYQWAKNGSDIPGQLGTSFTINNLSSTDAGNYSCTVKNNCGISIISNTAVLAINIAPFISLAPASVSQCPGTDLSLNLTISGTPPFTYQWYRDANPVGGNSSYYTKLNISAVDAGNYKCVVSSVCGAFTSNISTVSVNPSPVTPVIGSNSPICSGNDLTLTSTTISGATYSWTGPNGFTSTTQNPTISNAQNNSSGTYYVIATVNGCSSLPGNSNVTVNNLPTAFNITGGGTFCAGGTGQLVGLSGSQSGVNYQLKLDGNNLGSTVPGNGGIISFGYQINGGNYTITATNTFTNCSNNMSGSIAITVNPLPTDYTVTGGGSFCSGGTGLNVALSGSQSGVTYQLKLNGFNTGTPLSGTGSSINFTNQTSAGTYTVIATNNTTGCISTMSGNASIAINALPNVFSITGGGAFCTGGTGVLVGLNGSQTGVNYQLYLNGIGTGLSLSGTGSSLNFGSVMTAGTYTVVATNTTTSCINNMFGSASVTVNALPSVFNVTGGGAYCAGGSGLPIGLSGSQIGVNYQLKLNGGNWQSAIPGDGSAINFGNQSNGAYTVIATNPNTSCLSNMQGSVTISVNPVPSAYTVTGGGSYCSGSSGITVGISGSQTGINYQLYINGILQGAPINGTGNAISYLNQSSAGIYTIIATNATTACTRNMTGSVSITINPSPTIFSVTGGGAYCSGGTGVLVGLNGSQSGINYQLQLNNNLTGSPLSGNGSSLIFGYQLNAGNYTIVATNTSTSCVNNMTGSVAVSLISAPSVYNVTGGGAFCAGGVGIAVGLSNSQNGFNYQLILNGTNTGSPVAGSGTSISFGNQTTSGNYTVAASGSGCSANMNGTVSITINALPTAFNVSGGGSFCSGGSGVLVGLSGSQTGVNYQVLVGGTNNGSPAAGTGSALSFGNKTSAGNYTIIATNATTSCVNNMTGSVNISVNALPSAFNITGGGAFCAGGSGMPVGLSGSQFGVNYQLLLNGSNWGAALPGTGSSVNFGNQSNGLYSVIATNTTTGCINNMTGSTSISTNALPTAFNVTGGGSYCSGSGGIQVGLSSSQSGVSYQLKLNNSNIGSPVGGNGAILSFGNQLGAGTYTVVASNNTTSCVNNMTGSVTISIISSPSVYNITGGGVYCFGGAGMVVGLSNSQAGFNYQLLLNGSNTGLPVTGSGTSISFGNQTTPGNYTVVASGGGCSANMNGTALVTINALPSAFSITGGGVYCSGGSGVVVGLSGSQTGVSYQLQIDGTNTGAPINGNGSAISFGSKTSAGSYTIIATNATTSCVNNMTGSVDVSVISAPSAYNVTGGGAYCLGGTGISVGLSNSQNGFNYQLLLNGTITGSPVAGSGASISFGNQTIVGNYTVAASGSGCSANMNGTVSVSINALPSAFNVTGGGSFCSGGSGVIVGLSGSQNGVNYQLLVGGSDTGSPLIGNGSAITFGNQISSGTYTVVATSSTTSCVNNMTGSVTVTVNALPSAFNVTGGGAYCSGGSGVSVGLAGSQTGVNYQLLLAGINNGSPIAGNGSVINFGNKTSTGTYTVVATNTTTSCINNMTGSVAISVISAPSVYNVTGGGAYCSGGTGVSVGLSNSQNGFNYQLLLNGTNTGSPIAGSGTSINFGNQTNVGNYTVVASGSGCSANMTGSVTVTINTLPSAFSVIGGGSFCSGGSGLTVGLSGSQSGVNYQLLVGGTNTGSPVAGSGSAISFGNNTISGTYTVVATNTSTSCSNIMTGSATVSINILPSAFNVTGGGSYCSGGSGVLVGLSGSQAGVNYQLLIGGTNTGSPVSGSGSAISFGNKTNVGTYTIVATNTTTSCVNNMTGLVVVSVNTLPSAFNVTGGGAFCSGGSGVAVGLSGSQSGVNYQLLNGGANTGSPLTGSGSALSFGNQVNSGTYTVVATNTTTSCVNNMTGSVTVSTSPLPSSFNITGGGSFCSGGSGVLVGLSGSQTGVNYQLLSNGSNTGLPFSGTGSAISFGNQFSSGTYTVIATNATTSCINNMIGSVTVSVNALPSAYNLTGGGNYCSGGSGMTVGLSGSQPGINYQLLLNGSNSGTPVAGTGIVLSFGNKTNAGTYTVIATNTITSCVNNMTGSVAITISSLPSAFIVTGGGSYCSGGSGVTVGLSGSQNGVNYQLLLNGSNTGLPLAGTGSAVSFSSQTSSGTYTVIANNATTSCSNNMSGSVAVSINALPSAFIVTGGGSYCSGGSGVLVGLSGSQSGVNYQILVGGVNNGSPVAGTSSALSFGNKTSAGTYTIVATNATTSCVNNMTGSVAVSVNALPSAFNVTGGGSFCSGGSGVLVGLSGSQTGVNYQVLVGGTNNGSPVAGTGSALNFGNKTSAGNYTIVATNATTSCINNMTSSINISVNALPSAFNVTGGGSFCSGGSGVLVGLSGSQTGVNYQVLVGGNNNGSPVAGTGSALSFGNKTSAGNYTIIATNATTSCVNNMTGSVNISVNALPSAFNVTGGGSYCSGGSGVAVGLSGSQTGVNYQVLVGGTNNGSPVAGTGSALSFGNKTSAGNYTIVATNATTSCVNNMTGSVAVSVNALPSAFNVTGGGSFCSGGSGVAVGLSGSQSGVSYQLLIGGSNTGSPVAGNGSAINFGNKSNNGTYTVVATNATTSCVNNMTGLVTVSIISAPSVYNVTGGGAYCSGGTGVNC